MQHLIRKVFTVKLVIPKRFLWFKWNKHVSLEIKQATIAETLAYFEGVKNPSDIHFFLVAILEHFRGKKFRKSERKYLIAQQKTIIEILEKTYLYGVENKETKVPSK
ncbi:MAG: hypothetical protein LBU27_03005 [Candidatus Peribacteria bacterium]|jgi:hypothetical protein|nr:hypothetical protein [Candidatus Peribacteria bacterium]